MPDPATPAVTTPPQLVITAGPNVWQFPCDTAEEAGRLVAEFRRRHPQAGFWGDFKAEWAGERID
jgi:hypothetical protein